MNNEEFNKCIESVLEEKQIENIPLDNIDSLRDLLYHSRLNKKFYQGFRENYEFEYGDDLSYFVMKVQDFIYRLHLLVNHSLINKNDKINIDSIADKICSFLENNSISFYEAVSYDDTDVEIIDEQNYCIKEALGMK